MSESDELRCKQCGAALSPGRRFCVACHAQIPGPRSAREDRLDKLILETPSTQRPDKTIVFISELRDARLNRERRLRRGSIAALISGILIFAGLAAWRAHGNKSAPAPARKRETMAKDELDQYVKALEFFHEDFGRYPTPEEGLGALARQPSTLAGWRGPYIDKDYSVDPWGADYVYQVLNDGADYVLSTYGPEGEEGGRPFLEVHSGADQSKIENRK